MHSDRIAEHTLDLAIFRRSVIQSWREYVMFGNTRGRHGQAKKCTMTGEKRITRRTAFVAHLMGFLAVRSSIPFSVALGHGSQ